MGRDILLAVIFALALGAILNLYRDELGPGDLPPEAPRALDPARIPGAFLPPAPRLVDGNPLAVHDARNTVLVIYNHGSINEFSPVACRPADNPPPILRDLAGQGLSGLKIVVYSYCSHGKVGVDNPWGFHGFDLPVTRRAKDIERLIRSFVDAGMPAAQIFLSGQSEGAWASLLVARRAAVPLGGVIAFAPGMAGQHEERSPIWWKIQNKHAARLARTARIDALVFAFEGDSYNRVEDLAFLARIDGIDLVALSGRSIEGIECRSDEPHFTAYRECFRQTQKTVILDFMKRRLW